MAVFLTGATGFLGRHLLARLLDRGEQVIALVNARTTTEANDKVTRAVASIDASGADRLITVLGDLSRPDLGLAPSDRERIVGTADWFIHCGAHVRFDAAADDARRVNVGGTRAVLAMARDRHRQSGLRRLDYISTAFVAGDRTDLVMEDELDAAVRHRNAYEATKFEAEQLVGQASAELPIAIFRPSIIVGEHDTGRTTSFHMIYWPARIYASGIWRICPGHPSTPIDLIPVDIAADAVLEIAGRTASIGRRFHIAAGAARSMTLREVGAVLQARFPSRRPVRFVDPGPWMRYVHPVLRHVTFGRTRRAVRSGEHFVPYFIRNPQFDVRVATEFLHGSPVVIPHVREYIERLFDYCIQTDWGRRTLRVAPGNGVSR